jgi:hypothetical protein
VLAGIDRCMSRVSQTDDTSAKAAVPLSARLRDAMRPMS